MASTVPVSYLTIIIYLSVVIVGTLLVGLLPPLVNLPECKDDTRAALPDMVFAEPLHEGSIL
jgi:hypothetical protein